MTDKDTSPMRAMRSTVGIGSNPAMALCISQDTVFREILAVIDRGGKGIALVTDAERKLIGTISDGDLRRAILADLSMQSTAADLLQAKANSPYPKPITASAGVDNAEMMKVMHDHVILQLPIVDDEGRLVDLVTWEDLTPDKYLTVDAVVMAGGFGKRLHPLTEETPKPMLPVGDRPIMEHIVNQLRDAGIDKVNVTTHYMPEKIKDYFGDGSQFGVEIDYVSESQPLGTAGALGLMDSPKRTMLVMNGDILTRVDFRAMQKFHDEYKADLTVGVRQYDLQIPYGVVQTSGVHITGIEEKPMFKFFVNAGIYLLEPSTHAFIPRNERFDMTDLIDVLLREKRRVVSFPIIEYWLDIGKIDDYKIAQEAIKDQG